MKTSVCSSCPPTLFSAPSLCLSMWSFLAKQLSIWVSSDPAHCIPLLLLSRPGTRRGLCPRSPHMHRSLLWRMQRDRRAWSDLKNVFRFMSPCCCAHTHSKARPSICHTLVIWASVENMPIESCLFFNPCICPATNYPLKKSQWISPSLNPDKWKNDRFAVSETSSRLHSTTRYPWVCGAVLAFPIRTFWLVKWG